jgi:hypothetical protein
LWDKPYDEAVARRLFDRLVESDPFDDSPCFNWTRGTNDRRYGLIHAHGKTRYAHRVAWEIYNGRYLESHEVVMHRCNNSLCCNPAHLKLGSLLENTQDAHKEGLMTHNRRGSRRKRLTVEQVLRIKLRLSYGHSAWTIALDMGIGHTTVRDIRSGKTWKKVKAPRK